MAKRSAQARLQEIFHHYYEVIAGKRPVTMDEVADWSIGQGLYPVPTIRSTAEEVDAWEKLWQGVKHAN